MRASILICTWQRPGPLRRCLEALVGLGWGPSADLEIVTIHPPGNDASEEMVRARFPGVGVVRADAANLSLQRNLGAQVARGEVLVYLDDDAWPKAAWLDEILAPFADPDVAAVGGLVVDPDGRTMVGPCVVTPYGRTRAVADPARPARGEVLALPGNNLAVRRAALFAAGGFDENFRYHLDETDLCVRLARAGGRLVHRGGAAIFHESAPGPHRRTLYDRDWYNVAKNQVYFAFRHVERARLLLAVVPWALQLPKLVRFLAWTVRGRLGPAAALSCAARHVRGIVAGYRKGLTRAPRLPLQATTA